jgi:hypothetical protein
LFEKMLVEVEREATGEPLLKLAFVEPPADRVEDKENEREGGEVDEKSKGLEENEDLGKGHKETPAAAPAPKGKRGRGRRGGGGGGRDTGGSKGDQGGLSAGTTNTQKKGPKVKAKTTKEVAGLFLEQLVEEVISHLMRIAAVEYHSVTALKDLTRGRLSPSSFLLPPSSFLLF